MQEQREDVSVQMKFHLYLSACISVLQLGIAWESLRHRVQPLDLPSFP